MLSSKGFTRSKTLSRQYFLEYISDVSLTWQIKDLHLLRSHFDIQETSKESFEGVIDLSQ